MSGIPNNPDLIDPAKTDVLIEKGEIKDYSIEENLNELLPVFNILAMNFIFYRINIKMYCILNLKIESFFIFNR